MIKNNINTYPENNNEKNTWFYNNVLTLFIIHNGIDVEENSNGFIDQTTKTWSS